MSALLVACRRRALRCRPRYARQLCDAGVGPQMSSGDGPNITTSPEDIDTRKLYRDCLKLTYYIAAEVRLQSPAVAARE